MPLENIVDKENKKSFLTRLKNKVTPYILSLSILAGAYVGCDYRLPWSTEPEPLELLNWAPSWSPDGTKIAFESGIDDVVYNYEIYVMNADGSNQTNLTNNSSQDKYPTWSPDGSKIAFYSMRDGNDEIYVMNADGSNQTRLTNNSDSDKYPLWSPDGSKIAFLKVMYPNWDIYVMNADGSNQTRLTYSSTLDK